MSDATEATVREYYRVVGDLSCTEEELREMEMNGLTMDSIIKEIEAKLGA